MIKIKNLHKQFGSNTIFENFNLNVKKGEMVAIVGASETGKSTLLNIIGSLEPFQDGRVIVDGIEVSKLSYKKQLSYLKETTSLIFQSYALIDEKSVYENIILGAKDTNEMQKNVKQALKIVDLEGFEERLVVTLSGGEQQRVALARAIIKDSKLILADEPTGNLDHKNSIIVINILKELVKQDKTVIVVTHDRGILKHFDKVIEI